MKKDTWLLAAVALIAALPPFWLTWHLHNQGSQPPKHISVWSYPATNPLSDVESFAVHTVTLRPEYHGRKLQNLMELGATLQNTGQSPILPSDYSEPLSVTVSPPWTILNVANALPGMAGWPSFQWSRVSDNKFIAQPALLNPGDLVDLKVFVTDSKAIGGVKPPPPKLIWNVRIINLSGLTYPDSPLNRMQHEFSMLSVSVDIPGNGVLFVLGQFAVYLGLWLVLFQRGGLFVPWTRWSVGLPILVALLSLASSEAMSTYVIGSPLTDLTGVPFWWNTPWIVLNTVGLLGCAWWVWYRRREPSAASQ